MRQYKVVPLIFLIALAGFYTQAQSVKRLDPQNFDKKLREAKEPILMDVRTAGEFAQGHLPKAQLFDIYSNDFKSKLSKLDKTKPVFVYCKGGSRSDSAVDILSDLGFREIYDLSGGISAWRKENKPIVNK